MPLAFRTLVSLMILLVASTISACSDSNVTLDVRVYTGLVPGPEFRVVQTTLFEGDFGSAAHEVASSEAIASFGVDFARGRDVAHYAIASGAYRVRVQLRRPDGALLVERTVALSIHGDTVLPVHITRDCVGVTCPQPGGSAEFATCLAGRCVDPRCSDVDREFCPDIAFCNAAADCDTPSECAESVCDEGICSEAAIAGACESAEWCNPDVGAGCQAIMESPPPSGPICGTICALPSEPCRFGYWTCTPGGPAACTYLQNRPTDFVCALDRVCDMSGECVMEMTTMPGPASVVVTPTSGLTTTEAGGTDTFSVRLGSAPESDVIIMLHSSNELEGSVAPASLTFTSVNWFVPQVVTVAGIDDGLTDGDVVYAITTDAAVSADARYNGLAIDDVSVVNTDDDVPGVLLSRTTGLVTSESGMTDSFTVRLATAPLADVTLPLTVDSAFEILVSPSTITFTPSDYAVPQTVTVTGLDDMVSDGNALVHAVLGLSTSSDSLYNGLDPADVSVTNIDDDTPGVTFNRMNDLMTSEYGDVDVFEVQLNTQPTADVTIDFRSGDETEIILVGATSLTFNSGYWGPQQIYVQGVDDGIDDGDKMFVVLSDPAVSDDPAYSGLDAADVTGVNLDNDDGSVMITYFSSSSTTEAGGDLQIGLRLGTEPEADVVLPIRVSDGSEAMTSTSALVFTPSDWFTDQFFSVVGVDDTIADGNIAFDVEIGPATGADAAYTSFASQVFTLTNVDDEVPSVIVSPTTGLVTSEMGATSSFTIVLGTEPDADVTIALTSSDVTEGTVAPSSVTFTPLNWDTPQTVIVAGVDDALVDGNVGYTIVTSTTMSSSLAFQGYPVADVSVTNVDAPPRVTVTPTAGLVTSEFLGTATFSLVLDRLPTANVTVALTSSNPTEGTVAPASVTFTPMNWSVPQVATVTGVDDLALDGDIAYTVVTGAASSADPLYSGVAVPDVSVTNRTALVQQAYTKASNADAGDALGTSVALSSDGNTMAVGAPNEDSNATGVGGSQSDNSLADSGAVYVYTRVAGTWTQQAYLKASNTGASDSFGRAVALSADGNTLVVGAPYEASNAVGINGDQSNNSAVNAGAVYVFTRSGSAWTQQAYVKASDTAASDGFGFFTLSLSNDGNTLAVGASGEDSSSTGVGGVQVDSGASNSGAVYVFTRAGTVWSQQAYIKASNTNAGDAFGMSGALSGDGNTLVVGAPFEASNAVGIGGSQADNSAGSAGAAYVFARSGMVWSQQAYVKASNARAGAYFGIASSLSLDGNTMVVGSHSETSCAVGIDGDQMSTGCMFPGAAYIFTRVGTVWSQQAYVKASYLPNNLQFGRFVSMSDSGNRVAIGGWYHGSAATGVNGSQTDTSRFESGAVYVFGRSGSVWSQEAFLKASNPGVQDHFGEAFALSRDATTLAVGAVQEDSASLGINGDETNNAAADSGAVYVFSLH